MTAVSNHDLVNIKDDLLGLQVIIALPVLLLGGTEIQSLALVRALVSAGCKVSVCCFYDYEADMVSAMEQAGARVDLLEQKRCDGLLHLFKVLIKYFREKTPHIVHVQYMAPGFIPVLAAWLSSVKVIFATVHQPGRTYGMKAKLLLKGAALLCSRFFCISRSVEESWFGSSSLFEEQKRMFCKHVTIYNAVDVDGISETVNSETRGRLCHELGLLNCKVLGCIGRMRNEKGQIYLVRAFDEVNRLMPDTKLLFVGGGPDEEALVKEVERLNLQGNVFFLGSKPQREAIEYLNVMDVVVVPSLFEGFGLTAAEAMAAKIPVVASKVDGLSEVVEDGLTGVLTPPGDPSELAKALLKVLQDVNTSEKMGLLGYERVKRMFSLNRFSESILSSYRQILSDSTKN